MPTDDFDDYDIRDDARSQPGAPPFYYWSDQRLEAEPLEAITADVLAQAEAPPPDLEAMKGDADAIDALIAAQPILSLDEFAAQLAVEMAAMRWRTIRAERDPRRAAEQAKAAQEDAADAGSEIARRIAAECAKLAAALADPRNAPDPGAGAEPPDRGAQPVGDPEPIVVFTPTPFQPRDPTKFPRRQFLYARHYARKYVSTTIAPGDVGKTALALAEAVSMALQKALLGVSPKRPLTVWYINLEDPREEIDRRILAICKHHVVDQAKLVGRLFVDSGRDMKAKLIVAEMNGRGLQIAIPVKEALIKALKDNKIDVLIIDPFVKTHRVSENDNVLMDAVASVFADVAKPLIARSSSSSTLARPAARR